MQTFLPYANFTESAKCLDRQRLGKQRVEAMQILKVLCGQGRVLKNGNIAWQNHPATKMWAGYELALFEYGKEICKEWIRRGYKDTCIQKMSDIISEINSSAPIGNVLPLDYPNWLGNKKLHASHRSNLLRKNPNWYNQFNWQEKNNLPYLWPVK